jgi:hypothetical protein
MQTTLDSTFVNRLRQMIAERYGKNLQIRQLMDLTGINLEQDSFTRGQDLHIPIKVNGAVLGTAVVPSADDLNDKGRQGITQLVRMVLEPAMYKWYLDQKEANLVEINKAHVELDNVRLFGEEQLPSIDDILSENPEVLNEGPEAELVSHLIHLEGMSPTTNKKVALTLHEITGRWAFVPFNDIKNQLHSAQDIAKMGAMTIFVEKIEALNEPEQELLIDYISEERYSDEPIIITSSELKMDQLGKSGLSGKLHDEISVNCFEVDKAPLTSQGLKEVLELFFMKDSPIDA